MRGPVAKAILTVLMIDIKFNDGLSFSTRSVFHINLLGRKLWRRSINHRKSRIAKVDTLYESFIQDLAAQY